jgi:hypothetical protein
MKKNRDFYSFVTSEFGIPLKTDVYVPSTDILKPDLTILQNDCCGSGWVDSDPGMVPDPAFWKKLFFFDQKLQFTHP